MGIEADGKRVLVVGCGYVGGAVARSLARSGHEVFGLNRSDQHDHALQADGIHPLHADIARLESLQSLPGPFDWIVNTAAPSFGGGAEQYQSVYLHGTRNLLAWLQTQPPSKYVYTSSTGVYGQNDGSLVDESSPTVATTVTSFVLIDTEQLLLTAARSEGFPAVILRAAGIYGPGRGYFLRQFLSGDMVLYENGRRFMNMIHRDDLAGIVQKALERGKPGEVYNAVDDEPVRQVEFFRWMAGELKRPEPPTRADGDPPGRSRRTTHKRVSNAKMKQQLGYDLIYPTFRTGYLTCRE